MPVARNPLQLLLVGLVGCSSSTAPVKHDLAARPGCQLVSSATLSQPIDDLVLLDSGAFVVGSKRGRIELRSRTGSVIRGEDRGYLGIAAIGVDRFADWGSGQATIWDHQGAVESIEGCGTETWGPIARRGTDSAWLISTDLVCAIERDRVVRRLATAAYHPVHLLVADPTSTRALVVRSGLDENYQERPTTLVDLSSGRDLWTAPRANYDAAAFVPGLGLAAVLRDPAPDEVRGLTVFDATSGRVLAHDPSWDTKFSDDRSPVAVWGSHVIVALDERLEILDGRTLATRHRLTGCHRASVHAIAATSDGRVLTGDGEGRLCTWQCN